MTQEIKNKLEQAAESARLPGKPWTVLTGDTKSAFILAAQTILENPGEWGLIKNEFAYAYSRKNEALKADNERLKAQLVKYSNALKRITDVFDIPEDDWEDSAIKMYEIAKEALKKEEQ